MIEKNDLRELPEVALLWQNKRLTDKGPDGECLMDKLLPALRLYLSLHPRECEARIKRLRLIAVTAATMSASAEDLAALLLFQDRFAGRTDDIMLKKNLPLGMFDGCRNRLNNLNTKMAELLKQYPPSSDLSLTDKQELTLLYQILERMKKAFGRRLSEAYGDSDIHIVNRALQHVQKKCLWERGAFGEPLMLRFLETAMLFDGLGADCNVMAAAVYASAFGKALFPISYLEHHLNPRQIAYAEAGGAALRRLQSEGGDIQDARVAPTDALALGILAADRLHDLKMTGVFGEAEREDSLADADFRDMLCRARLSSLAELLYGLLWEREHAACAAEMERAYQALAAHHLPRRRQLLTQLSEAYEDISSHGGDFSSCRFEVTERLYAPHEIYAMEKAYVGSENFDPVGRIEKRVIPLSRFCLTLSSPDGRQELSSFASAFINSFLTKLEANKSIITDIATKEDGTVLIQVEDIYRVRYVCELSFGERTGLFGSGLLTPDGEDLTGTEDYICVLLQKGDQYIRLPKGSTVLDVAFAIHEDLGIAFQKATVNGNDVPINKVVEDGDQIFIHAAIGSQMPMGTRRVDQARIGWLRYVVTERAERKLIAYFTEKYEGDYAESMTNAPDDELETVEARVFSELSGSFPIAG